MSTEIILPIITLILGLFLNELSYIFRTSRENKKEVGLVISFLLDIRHQLNALKIISAELKKYIPQTPELEIQIRNILGNFFPQSDDFSQMFNESINSVSKFNPLLGFRLRSKDQFIPIMQKLRNLSLADKSSTILFNEMDNIISSKYVETIEEMLIELSKVHGIKTWFRIKKNLSKEYDITKEFEDIFSLINKYKK